MYMGHLGIGLGARRLSHSLPLWALLLATILPDASDALSGFTPWVGWWVEFSHTILGVASLATFMGLVGGAISRHFVASVLAGLLVVSHLLADFITSRIRPGGAGPRLAWVYIITAWLILPSSRPSYWSDSFFYRQSLHETRRRWKVLLGMGVTLIGFQLLGDTLVAG